MTQFLVAPVARRKRGILWVMRHTCPVALVLALATAGILTGGCEDRDAGPDGADVASQEVTRDGEGADFEQTQPCNGRVDLCGRRLEQVVFPTTHNAMSAASDDWFAPNQQYGIARQLADGVRAMMWDTHWDGEELALCHGLCALGRIPLSEALATLKDFLDDNPREVVVLIVEDRTPVADTSEAFIAAGLAPYIVTLATLDDGSLPTLEALIDAGQRLIVTAEQGAPPPQWFHHVWSWVSDTGYTWRSPEDFTCDCNRGCPADDRSLFLLNHWVSDSSGLPDASQAEDVNSYKILHERAVKCWEQTGKVPNFVAVDHYATGDLFEVVDALNTRVSAIP